MITLHQPNILRRYNLMAYVLGYLVGLLIVLSTVTIHALDSVITTITIMIVAQIVTVLLAPMMASGG